MRNVASLVFATALLAHVSLRGESKLKMQDLPEAVQKTVKQQLGGATVVGISKEREKGVTQYEIESKLNGKARDFNVDEKGQLLVVEEEVALETIPAAAREAISKKIAGGKLRRVEIVTKGSETSYEASFVSKAGKKGEANFAADGTVHK